MRERERERERERIIWISCFEVNQLHGNYHNVVHHSDIWKSIQIEISVNREPRSALQSISWYICDDTDDTFIFIDHQCQSLQRHLRRSTS